MGSWAYLSTSVHATASCIDGPYKRQNLAVGTWIHNTLYVYSPQDKMHLLYSIGNGSSPPSCNPPIPCKNGRTPGAHGLRPPSPWPANITCSPGSHATAIHYSKSWDGPWISAGFTIFSGAPSGHIDPHTSSFGYSNPAPLLLDNGTVLMVTRGNALELLPFSRFL